MRFEIQNIQVNAMDEALNVTELISLSLVWIRKPSILGRRKTFSKLTKVSNLRCSYEKQSRFSRLDLARFCLQ